MLSFSSVPIFSSRFWELSNVSAEFTPVISLSLDQMDNNRYGYFESPTRFTGLRASFELGSIDGDVLLSLQGWDIDVSDETAVYINGTQVGNLGVTNNNSYGPTDSFLLTNDLLNVGLNMIELVQRDTDGTWVGSADEKWAVKDMLIRLVTTVDLSVSNILIAENSIKKNIPFSVAATISNTGEASSQTTTATFHVSSDEIITSTDQEVASLIVDPILPAETVILNVDVQTSQVNTGYFLGVCIESVTGESNVTNNCSVGVPIQGIGFIPSILNILLGENT